jgi:glyceraldehyde-3-phosphate dehydrogenase (NADP+)
MFPTADAVPAEVKPPHVRARVLIDGEIREWSGPCREVISPLYLRPSADAEPQPTVLGSSPAVSAEVALEALAAAQRAWAQGTGAWPTMRVEERIEAFERFLTAMTAQREAVCRLIMWEIAKTWPDAQTEFDRTVQYLRDTVEALKELDRQSARLTFRDGIIAQVRRAPLGVTLSMGPFNYPLNETMTTLMPALIMGNPVVVKLPRIGQLLWDPLLEAFRDCFPRGVVNVINGDGKEIVQPLMRSGKVDVLAFIGSSRSADAIKAAHPHPHRLRCILGLDAKNPAVILPDADLQVAVSECIKGTLSFNGQRCTALKILFAHRSVAARFADELAAAIDALPNAFPWVKGARLTPLCEPGKAARLQALVDDAVDCGASLINRERGGGTSYCTAYHPAVLAGVNPKMRIFHEEQFGPVVPIVAIDDTREFVEHVIASSYGQQASIFGQDPTEIGSLIDVLSNQVCRINLNSQCQRGPDVFPFTGRKDSAEGTLSTSDALRAFSIRSMVAVPHTAPGKRLVRGVLDGDHSKFLSTDVIL